VLRERFVLLHAGMVVSMLVYVLTAGGIVTAFTELPLALLATAGPASFALGAALAGLFISAFLEPGILHARMCRIVNYTA
ncbi:7TM diverse intracellular signaling domain-containing protein, partial [Rhodococcoides yunnanense]|uniref:7TM diverse intracellular signaling domain-containing protein n=1 Tax=Rhodococcoides yunnanense TaxID=278209 RepID=UPI0022B1F0D6